MKPKIAIILTPAGIDSVSVLSGSGSKELKEGYKICSYIQNELTNFEKAVCNKLRKIDDDTTGRNAAKK